MDLSEFGCFTYMWASEEQGMVEWGCICGYESMPMSERMARFFRILHERDTARPEPLLGLQVPDA